MGLAKLCSLVVLLCTLSFASNRACYAFENTVEKTALKVGEELWKESLPLQRGSRFYKLEGLKPHTWYEVKISYPASIPACFSLQLMRGDLDSATNFNRRFLNTEKIIFKTESLELIQNQGGMHVLVTVEPEGVVAIRGVNERESIIYNIGSDPYSQGAVQSLVEQLLARITQNGEGPGNFFWRRDRAKPSSVRSISSPPEFSQATPYQLR